MKKQFYLEGERITLRHAKLLLGEKRYAQALSKAWAAFLCDPVNDIRLGTREGILTIIFQPG